MCFLITLCSWLLILWGYSYLWCLFPIFLCCLNERNQSSFHCTTVLPIRRYRQVALSPKSTPAAAHGSTCPTIGIHQPTRLVSALPPTSAGSLASILKGDRRPSIYHHSHRSSTSTFDLSFLASHSVSFKVRLLKTNDDGFNLAGPQRSDISPYAILSHTWGADHDEVTYQDLSNGTGRKKYGYKKPTFCMEQAAKDDLYHSWIDTCCINKSSEPELSEAIRSMFKWYRNASKCYTYLSDVSSTDCDPDSVAFSESRWFSQGWTLQELLAPSCV